MTINSAATHVTASEEEVVELARRVNALCMKYATSTYQRPGPYGACKYDTGHIGTCETPGCVVGLGLGLLGVAQDDVQRAASTRPLGTNMEVGGTRSVSALFVSPTGERYRCVNAYDARALGDERVAELLAELPRVGHYITWLALVQSGQDRGDTFGEALSTANAAVKDVAKELDALDPIEVSL